ncbi:MAG TPA: tRNA (cytosine(32)/uridine(32)-2'-O)-methyltransferase TrmJ, partial [Gammaproteobacteria bacterium]|nr:tRNA (cytosine(32)/uridine(32)-2'-O)-methyltransferase TrmJ [Gammaproteobacteria bacterium]
FGREHSGLTNEEMDRCNCLLHIPANPVYPSLNLGAAVQVVTYETMMAARGGAAAPAAARGLATAEQVEGFYRHLEQALMDVEFLDPAQPRLLMRRLRRLFSRAQLEEREVNILRGILTAAQRAAGR